MKNRTWLFYIVTSVFWFSLYAYVPYVSPYADDMGANLRLVGLIGGAYGFMQMAIRFPLGIFSDKIGKRKFFVLLGMLFAAVAAFVVFLFPNPYTLLAARALGGVAASSWVAFTVLGASYYPAENTAKSMGNLSACNALGRMAAFFIGGLTAQRLGIEFAFLLGGIAALIGVFAGFFITEKPPEKKATPTIPELLLVVKNKQLIACAVLGIISMFVSTATTLVFMPLAAVSLNSSQLQLGFLGVVSTVPAIFISPLATTLMPDKLGVCKTLIMGFLLVGIGSALVAVTSSLEFLFAVQIIGSSGASILGALLLGLCIRDIPARNRAAAMGFFQAVYAIGMFLGPSIMGQVSYIFSLNTAFIFTGIIGFIGAFITLIYAKRGYLTY